MILHCSGRVCSIFYNKNCLRGEETKIHISVYHLKVLKVPEKEQPLLSQMLILDPPTLMLHTTHSQMSHFETLLMKWCILMKGTFFAAEATIKHFEESFCIFLKKNKCPLYHQS